MFHHNDEAVLQASEIEEMVEMVDKGFPRLLELLETHKGAQRGSGWVIDRVETLWLGRRQEQGRSLLNVVFKCRIVSGQRSCGQAPFKYLTNDGLD